MVWGFGVLTYGCHLAARSLQKRQNLSTLGGISGMQTRLCFGTHQSRTTDDLRPRLEPILLIRGECTFDARNVSRRNCLEQPGDLPVGA
jgi:hypothetical protein